VTRYVISQITPISTGIFPLHLQDSPDGFPSLSAIHLGLHIREPHKTPAHTHDDPVRADMSSYTLKAH